MFIYLIFEITLVPVSANVLGINIQNLSQEVMGRFLIFLSHMTIMLLIISFIRYINLDLEEYISIAKIDELQLLSYGDIDIKREKRISFSFYLVLFFLLIQGIFVNLYIWGDVSSVFNLDNVFNSHLFVNGVLVILNLLLILIIYYLLVTIRMERNDIIKRIKEKNALRLDWEKQTQLHDRNHHLGMLYMLLQVNKIDRAKEYLQGIIGEIKKVNISVSSGNDTLDALIKCKVATAREMGIDIEITVLEKLQELNINDWNIVRIIGNLLDNAVEAIESERKSKENLNDSKCRIELIIHGSNNKNILKVITFGVLIPAELKTHIFERGFSSKDEKGHGLGLSICKELLEKVDGKIEIDTGEDEQYTSFRVEIPAG
ncbi:MAG: sensor histidine kinase [Bacillota bacterium]